MVTRNKLGKIFFCFKKYPTSFSEDFVYFFDVENFHRKTFSYVYGSFLAFFSLFHDF